MHKIWISVVIFAAIFIGSIFYIHYLNQFSAVMTGYAAEAYDSVGKSPDTVENNLHAVLERLESNKMLLCSFIDHRMLNEIEDSAKSSLVLLQSGENNRLLLELTLLREKISQITDLEMFDLKNIL